jgi:Bifunctional DNA primase/polymerase, N-terminal/AAA domain
VSVYDLAAEGTHVFPVDHPSLPKCAGLHKTVPCDGKRGKHPSVAWAHAATCNPKMIATWFEGTTRNVGISCGPSGLVVLDEDEDGALAQWATRTGVDLPETYTVTTGKGRHLYYRYDHTVAPIKNSAARLFGDLAVDVRGAGGFVVAAGSTHEQGRTYEGNGAQIAPLPDELAQRLLAAQTKPPAAPVTEDFSSSPNDTPIAYLKRHQQLLQYAGRLRNAGLDHTEAEILFRKRWELCEQPPGKEAPYERAKQTILDDVYARYEAGCTAETVDGMPRLWNATDLRPTTQPRWLAKNRLPRAAVSLLIGDEGIGKSLLWVLVIAYITTGKPFPELGIPARDPATVILVLTEDDWSTTVRPRLEVAGADLAMVQVICTEDDGSGAPVFPRDLFLIDEADPAPALVVVDAWLDTVPAGLSVRDPQQARQALHPWKEVATTSDAAVLLLCHTNRVESANARDRYGATAELRKKARMTLYAQRDDEDFLVVGPEKMNTAAPIPASRFTIKAIQRFAPTPDSDGTVPQLVYADESDMTAREQLAENYAADHDAAKGDAIGWLATYLATGPRWASDAHRAREEAGFSEKTVKTAKRKLGVESERNTANGPWFWRLPQHKGVPEGRPQVPEGPSRDPWTSGTSGPSGVEVETFQKSPFSSQDSQRTNRERQGPLGTPGPTPVDDLDLFDPTPTTNGDTRCACGNALVTPSAIWSGKCKPCRDREEAA